MSATYVSLTAHTREKSFSSNTPDEFSFLYDRVISLSLTDGPFTQHIGDLAGASLTERRLYAPAVIGGRILQAFEDITEGEPYNCHRFGRAILGISETTDRPSLDTHVLSSTEVLHSGATGVIAGIYGISHTIGYGIGEEGLQVLSSDGELGFALNVDVLGYYRRLYPDEDHALYELPAGVPLT